MKTIISSQEDREMVISKLIKEGLRRLEAPIQNIPFSDMPGEYNVLENFRKFPHLFVLGCVMDRQIKAERAWTIPHLIGKEIGGFEFEKFLNLSEEDVLKIFNIKKLHRFNNDMAKCFYNAIQLIHSKYNDHAENIWANNPKSATIIRRFLEFNGIGIKIANMAWRGEKEAIKQLKNNYPDLYEAFKSYVNSNNLSDKFKLYEKMIDMTFTDKYKRWTEKDEIIIKKDFSVVDQEDSIMNYVKSLF